MAVAANCPAPGAQPTWAGNHHIVFEQDQLIHRLQRQEIEQSPVLIGGDAAIGGLQHHVHQGGNGSGGAIGAAIVKNGQVHRPAAVFSKAMDQPQQLLAAVVGGDGDTYAPRHGAAPQASAFWRLPLPFSVFLAWPCSGGGGALSGGIPALSNSCSSSST